MTLFETFAAVGATYNAINRFQQRRASLDDDDDQSPTDVLEDRMLLRDGATCGPPVSHELKVVGDRRSSRAHRARRRIRRRTWGPEIQRSGKRDATRYHEHGSREAPGSPAGRPALYCVPRDGTGRPASALWEAMAARATRRLSGQSSESADGQYGQGGQIRPVWNAA